MAAPLVKVRTALVSLAAMAAALTSACARLAFTVANVPTSFGPVERRADLGYGEHARQKLDVYALPAEDASGRRGRPIVVFWYGGGFTHGSKNDYRFVGAALAERGVVAVLPDYRVYPDVVFPQILDDPARAVAWAQRHAHEFGGDAERIVLMGHSSGAYFAAFLAFEAERLRTAGAQPESIRGLVGLSGPYELTPNSATLNAIFGPPHRPVEWQPVRHVSADDPPSLLLHGLDDDVVWVKHAENLRDALTAAGVRVEAHFYPARGHVDTVAAFAWAARRRVPALERTVRFIESVTTPRG